MAGDAVGLREQHTDRLTGTEAITPSSQCNLALIARAVSCWSGQSVKEEEVRWRAIAVGLLRQVEDPESQRLDCRCASRLLIAGYQLPACVEPATLKGIQHHLRQGRSVLAPLVGLEKEGTLIPELLQLHHLRTRGLNGPWLRLGEPEAPLSEVLQVPLDRFLEAWAVAGKLLFVTAPGWEALPRTGSRFFGGARDPEGTFHWDTAEITTDGQGGIVRC